MQPNLFDDPQQSNNLLESEIVAVSRGSDPETSKAAARSIGTAILESLVIAALRKFGPMTTEQLAERTKLSLVTVSPRMKPLSRKGLVRDSGKKRENASGRRAIVWEVAA